MNKLIHLMLLIIIEFVIVSGQHATRRSVNHLHHKHLDSHWSNFKLSHKKLFKNVTHELHRYMICQNIKIKKKL